MRVGQTIVLKFGGSVLGDELHMRLAVHEIYRWRRKGMRVVAVVSALAGRTDELLKKCTKLYRRRAPRTEAAVAATGELESAALLGLHLDRAGLPAIVLTPAAVGLRATGHPLDASPIAVDTKILERALQQKGTVVLPGYVAMGPMGETVVLGRGGSDLTALFVAHALGRCRCRLIKDVRGLFDQDPAKVGRAARRYKHATYEDALATDGSILQHKAIKFARRVDLQFEVGCLGEREHSVVGGSKTRFQCPPAASKPLRVALLGHGTVGAGVSELLRQRNARAELVCVVVRTPSKHEHLARDGVFVCTDPLRAIHAGVDVVIEVMGGIADARPAVEAALRHGVHVVTANKTLMAEHGESLRALARIHGVQIRFSASVGAAMPILEALGWHESANVVSIRAVLNGTVNFMLNEFARGAPIDAALARAQALGFAEADAARDLSGLDAADKLRVLSQSLQLDCPSSPSANCQHLRAVRVRARGSASTLRQIASLKRDGSRAHLSVTIESVLPGDPLLNLSNEENAAVITWSDGTTRVVRGAGAGRWPTAEAVVADLMSIARQGASGNRPRSEHRLQCGL